MADTFQLEVATPEQLLIDEQVTEVQLPGKGGYMGILAGHAPLLSELGAGLLTYEGGSGSGRPLVIDGGFVEVFENHVRVLADSAEYASEISREEAQRDLDKANEDLKKAQSESETEAAMGLLERAQAHLDASSNS
jgi:F-type H+-transporting ATPase subunit epsilon